MNIKFEITNNKIPFLDLAIGNPFYAYNKIWIRTAYEAATQLESSGDRSSCCNFNIDPEDKLVTQVLVKYND